MFANPVGHIISSHIFLPITIAGIFAAPPPGHSSPDHRRPNPQSLLADIPATKNYSQKNGCTDSPYRNPCFSSVLLAHYGYAAVPADPHAPGPRPAPPRSPSWQ